MSGLTSGSCPSQTKQSRNKSGFVSDAAIALRSLRGLAIHGSRVPF